MELLRYRADNGWVASCGVTLWDAGPGVVLLVLTEPPDHHGPSITNNVGRAAEAVVRLARLDPRRTLCVEHYARVPPDPDGDPLASVRRGETFDLVRFTVGRDGAGRVSLSPPRWSPLRTRGQWADLRAACAIVGPGGWAWGDGPPLVRVPAALARRIDGTPPREVDAASLAAEQAALARRLTGGLGPAMP